MDSKVCELIEAAPIAREILESAISWEPHVRLVGNVNAGDIAHLCQAVLSLAALDAKPEPFDPTYAPHCPICSASFTRPRWFEDRLRRALRTVEEIARDAIAPRPDDARPAPECCDTARLDWLEKNKLRIWDVGLKSCFEEWCDSSGRNSPLRNICDAALKAEAERRAGAGEKEGDPHAKD